MLLLDRQVRPPEGPRIAQFFSREFLGAVEALTPEEATQLFSRRAHALRAVLARELAPEEGLRFERAVRGALSATRVDLDEWLTELDLPEAARRKVGTKLGPKAFPERRVEIVQEVVERERERKRVFRGDFDLRLEIPPDFPAGQYRDEVRREPGKFGGREYHAITLETEMWREQP